MKSPIAEILITFLSLIINANAQCEFKSPGQDYQASWYLDKTANIVHFKLTATQKSTGGFWTGIGFGGKMQGADLIIVSSVNNQVSVSDRTGIGYTQPIEDREQDVKEFKGRLENGVIQAEFTRAVKTGDARDKPIIDEAQGNCQEFIFPISGGSSTGNAVQKHTQTPVVQKICNIDQCPPFGDSSAGGAGTETLTSGGSGDPTTPVGTGNEALQRSPTTRGNRPTEEYQTTPAPTSVGGANTGSGTGAGVGVGGVSPGESGDCSFKEGDYNVNWVYDQSTQSVKFSISAPLAPNKWTGVGFGQSMQGGDMVVIYDANGVVNISDRHGVGYAEPLVDARQDATAFQNTYNGNALQAQFTRRVNTGDVDDLPLEDPAKNNCQYFIFPVNGGTITVGADGKISVGKHAETPKTKLICKINACTGAAPAPTQPPVAGVVTPGGGSQPTVGVGQVVPGGEGRPCPPRDDHQACKNYIDDYLNVVYTKFPKTDPITQKACGLLQTHQAGIVYTECCHYLSQPQTCGRFVGGPQAAPAGGANTAPSQPQPAATAQNPKPQPQPEAGGINTNNNNPNNQPDRSLLPNRQNAALPNKP